MVEAGIAWAHNKAIVIFRSDSRSLIEGNCNPLVLGLSDFSCSGPTVKSPLVLMQGSLLRLRTSCLQGITSLRPRPRAEERSTTIWRPKGQGTRLPTY